MKFKRPRKIKDKALKPCFPVDRRVKLLVEKGINHNGIQCIRYILAIIDNKENIVYLPVSSHSYGEVCLSLNIGEEDIVYR